MDLYNKYLPKTVDDYFLHPELQSFLKNLKNKDLPNLILYGQEGAGKKSFLSVLFPGKKIKNVRSIKYNSKTVDYTIYNTPHTIEIDSKELKIYNKYLLQNIIKNIAETKRVNDNKSKIIVIHNAHFLDKDFQYILRKMIELYINSAKFILISNSLNKIINPIKSRCLCIKVKNPELKEIEDFVKRVKKEEKMKITATKIKKILETSNRNLKKAILELETYTYSDVNVSNKINESINKIVSSLKNKNFNLKLIETWEKRLYKLIINFSIEKY
jgi:replication factor C subunit 3/5